MNNSIELHLFSGLALLLLTYYSFKTLRSPKVCAFALMPLVLALEQFSLFLLLVTAQHPKLSYLNDFFTLFFLILSQVIWPIWVPFSLQRMEQTWSIQKILTFFTYLGLVSALIGTWDIIFYNVHIVNIGDRFYLVQTSVGYFQKFGIYFWIAATFLPAFISYTPRMWVFALTLAGAGIYLLFLNHNDFIIFTPYGTLALAITLYIVLLGMKNEYVGIRD
ncbi:MAG: hypothetical protein RLZZ500_532 [Bacteroidota bacterium]|jgi:hypothetical protein